jgi:hypothetical protein
MEDEEALKSGALIGQLADPVQHKVDNLLACRKKEKKLLSWYIHIYTYIER